MQTGMETTQTAMETTQTAMETKYTKADVSELSKLFISKLSNCSLQCVPQLTQDNAQGAVESFRFEDKSSDHQATVASFVAHLQTQNPKLALPKKGVDKLVAALSTWSSKRARKSALKSLQKKSLPNTKAKQEVEPVAAMVVDQEVGEPTTTGHCAGGGKRVMKKGSPFGG